MENFFEQFVRDELEWICNDDMDRILLENFEGELEEDELDEHYGEFINEAVNDFCNDEYVIQNIHDWMYDAVVNVIKDYLNRRDEE